LQISQTELAKRVGVGGSTASSWERVSDNRIPTVKQLPRLAKLFNKSVDWIINGDPLADELQINTSSLLNPEEMKEFLAKNLDTIANALAGSYDTNQTGIYPVIEWNEIDQMIEENNVDSANWLPCPAAKAPGDGTFILECPDLESMYSNGKKGLYEGDFLFIDPDEKPRNNSLVLVKMGDEYTIRKYQKDGGSIVLSVLNQDWHEKSRPLSAVDTITGTIVIVSSHF